MIASKTSLTANDLPHNLKNLRFAIEEAVPHGRTDGGGRNDVGAWSNTPNSAIKIWNKYLNNDFDKIVDKHPQIGKGNLINHLGTLGTGNHFIEICLDQSDFVWIMLHSGSRGVGNRIGTYFIDLAQKDMKKHKLHLPSDTSLSYLREGTQYFDDYVLAVEWAQDFARWNREIMLNNVIDSIQQYGKKHHKEISNFSYGIEAVNCHHNYVSYEKHFGENVYVTRKGAVSAKKGQLGIIPGSMGVKSYIVRGLGLKDSFESCSHGAGRIYSRTAAKKKFSLKDHEIATKGVECKKDSSVIDETPGAYKDIDAVIKAQSDLVEVVHTLKQILCVKG
eukprot:TRINITY_DN12683_c0_g1_i1.p1 TRINITY_DN12683_c0_g1~~TRINITY_DN12683_c0_g1_i1.p1  ORF type:complete len:334 (+),score=64.30 TRINITY_DN12683_c0_g1_i1:163-1164(+)